MLISASALAGKGLTHNQGGIAIDGYDPVAYFTQSDAVEGDASITHDWQGATWQFSSSENRDLFAANPEAYAPQYGGYCAFAASNGYIAPTDANAWTVHDGRLYLNYSLSVRSRWSEDIPGRIKSADGHWPEIKKQL
ncbi:MAG: YHS domain-containing (seleno)protein [Pseudomonadota bacterium]